MKENQHQEHDELHGLESDVITISETAPAVSVESFHQTSFSNNDDLTNGNLNTHHSQQQPQPQQPGNDVGKEDSENHTNEEDPVHEEQEEEEIFMEPPELRNNNEVRTGAFRVGGRHFLGTITPTTSSSILEDTSTSSSTSRRPSDELPDRVELSVNPPDILVHAELVNELAVEYVEAEPISVNESSAMVEDDDQQQCEPSSLSHAGVLKRSSSSRPDCWRMRWKMVLQIVVLTIGLIAMVLGVAMSLQGQKDVVDDEKNLALPVDDQFPLSSSSSSSSQNNNNNNNDYLPQEQQELHADYAVVSLHAVIWGYYIDGCDEFDLPSLQISCGGGEVEVLLTDRDRSCCSIQYSSASCDFKKQNKSAIVIFRCLRNSPDMPGEATVSLPVAQARKCKHRQATTTTTKSNSSHVSNNMVIGGTGETFLALGRFCNEDLFGSGVNFRNHYDCQSGETGYAYAQDRRRSNSLRQRRRSLIPKLCYANNSCASSNRNCEQQDDDGSCMLTECNFALDSLEITDSEPDCVIDDVSRGGDGSLGMAQLEMYRNIVFEQMFLPIPS